MPLRFRGSKPPKTLILSFVPGNIRDIFKFVPVSGTFYRDKFSLFILVLKRAYLLNCSSYNLDTSYSCSPYRMLFKHGDIYHQRSKGQGQAAAEHCQKMCDFSVSLSVPQLQTSAFPKAWAWGGWNLIDHQSIKLFRSPNNFVVIPCPPAELRPFEKYNKMTFFGISGTFLYMLGLTYIHESFSWDSSLPVPYPW